jgi:hypothetical protein
MGLLHGWKKIKQRERRSRAVFVSFPSLQNYRGILEQINEDCTTIVAKLSIYKNNQGEASRAGEEQSQ